MGSLQYLCVSRPAADLAAQVQGVGDTLATVAMVAISLLRPPQRVLQTFSVKRNRLKKTKKTKNA